MSMSDMRKMYKINGDMIPKGRRATTLRHVRAFFSFFFSVFYFSRRFCLLRIFLAQSSAPTIGRLRCECRYGASAILVYFSFHAISALFSRNRFCRVQLGRKLNLLYFFLFSLTRYVCKCVCMCLAGCRTNQNS